MHELLQKPPGQKRKKRPFYENSLNKFYEEEPLAEQMNEHPLADPSKGLSLLVNVPSERQTVNPLYNFNVADIQDMIKARLTRNQKDTIYEIKANTKINLVNLSYKETMKEIDSFIAAIKQITEAERFYGASLENFGKSAKTIFSSPSDVLFVKDMHQTAKYDTSKLDEYELSTLKKRFGESFVAKEFIDLPEWKRFKMTKNTAGLISKSCSTYIEDVLKFFGERNIQ